MDRWKFFAITHGRMTILNPMNAAKLDEVVGLLDLAPEARIFDAGCGKADLLIRAVSRWGCTGVGVDLSPAFAADARARVADNRLDARITIVESSAKDYAAPAESFDVSVCLGATWIWGDYKGTLAALGARTKPGGMVIVGEPFWKRPPSPEYLEATDTPRGLYATHRENVEAGAALGLRFLYALESSVDDWDRYEGYQSYATERYARAHPDDPDVPELLQRARDGTTNYLKWGRDEMGWAIYMFLS